MSKPSASAPRDKGEIGANLSVSVNQSLEESVLKQAVLLNISRKCISSGQNQNQKPISGALIWFAHIRRQHHSYGFQLVACHRGLRVSMHHEEKVTTADRLRRSTHPHWKKKIKQNKTRVPRRDLQTGVGGVKRGEKWENDVPRTLNAADGCIHHRRMPLSGGGQDAPSHGLVISICDAGLKV